MIEFITGMMVLMVPLLLAVAEIYRFEQKARRTIMRAQQECITLAAQRSRSGSSKGVTVRVEDQINLMESTRRVFPNMRLGGRRLARTYYIDTGTGRE